MADCLKSSNQLVNTLIFPGSILKASYDHHDFVGGKILYIPILRRNQSCWTSSLMPSHIPVLLRTGNKKTAAVFVIHFHGNACDLGQIVACAEREGYSLNAHYLIVEYPSYGVALGYPSEETVNLVAMSVYNFVENVLGVPHSRIILIGRSIGTGPVCALAADLELMGKRPAAIVLQSPFSSMRYAASDLVGCLSWCMLDRWQSWKPLCGEDGDITRAVKSPVLFIHADGDKIIDYQHSVTLHEARCRAGLPSEFFTQESSEEFVKGHNFYDYDQDVIIPTRDFLAKHIRIGTGRQSILRLPAEAISSASLVPPAYRDPELSKRSKCTCTAVALWLFCPIVFPLEACLACSYSAGKTCCSIIPWRKSSRRYRYDTRKQRGEKPATEEYLVYSGLRNLAKTGSVVFTIEDEPHRTLPQAAVFSSSPVSPTDSQDSSGDLERINTSVENPLLINAINGQISRTEAAELSIPEEVDEKMAAPTRASMDMSTSRPLQTTNLRVEKIVKNGATRRGSDSSVHRRLNIEELGDLLDGGVKVSTPPQRSRGSRILGNSTDFKEELDANAKSRKLKLLSRRRHSTTATVSLPSSSKTNLPSDAADASLLSSDNSSYDSGSEDHASSDDGNAGNMNSGKDVGTDRNAEDNPAELIHDEKAVREEAHHDYIPG